MKRARKQRESLVDRFHRDETLQRLAEWVAIAAIVLLAGAATANVLGPRVVAAANTMFTAF